MGDEHAHLVSGTVPDHHRGVVSMTMTHTDLLRWIKVQTTRLVFFFYKRLAIALNHPSIDR